MKVCTNRWTRTAEGQSDVCEPQEETFISVANSKDPRGTAIWNQGYISFVVRKVSPWRLLRKRPVLCDRSMDSEEGGLMNYHQIRAKYIFFSEKLLHEMVMITSSVTHTWPQVKWFILVWLSHFCISVKLLPKENIYFLKIGVGTRECQILWKI